MHPEPRDPYRGPSPISEHGHHRLGVLLVLLALMVVAALVAFLVVRIANRRVPPPSGFALAGPPMSDPALSQLRLRYARGEISRDDYLQTSADLGAQPPPLPI